jgi:hypothetical protein
MAHEDKLTDDDIVRFWALADKDGGPDACWPWLGWWASYDPERPVFSAQGRQYGARGLACYLAHGTAGLSIDRECGCKMPNCVNPRHLYPSDYTILLSVAAVQKIRVSRLRGVDITTIAEEMGLRHGTVVGVASGRTYR